MNDNTLAEVAYKYPLYRKIFDKFTNAVRLWRLRRMRHLLRKLSVDSNYVKHCRRELKSWFTESDDEPNRWMADGTEELLMLFSTHGHSGGSYNFAIQVFSAMAAFKPWSPLTGADDEWTLLDYDDDMRYQNKRCSHVFKAADGRAYDGQAKVFREPDGACFTNSESRVYIKFPYTPKVEYVDVPASGERS